MTHDEVSSSSNFWNLSVVVRLKRMQIIAVQFQSQPWNTSAATLGVYFKRSNCSTVCSINIRLNTDECWGIKFSDETAARLYLLPLMLFWHHAVKGSVWIWIQTQSDCYIPRTHVPEHVHMDAFKMPWVASWFYSHGKKQYVGDKPLRFFFPWSFLHGCYLYACIGVPHRTMITGRINKLVCHLTKPESLECRSLADSVIKSQRHCHLFDQDRFEYLTPQTFTALFFLLLRRLIPRHFTFS